MRLPLYHIVLVAVLLQSCTAPRIKTVWKPRKTISYPFEKIMVVAIVPGYNDSQRAAIEREMVRQLLSTGNRAVSYSDGALIYELNQQTTQEAAYFTLCEKGIDGVLTVAKVCPASTISLAKGTRKRFPSYFYFQHIWEYKGQTNSKELPDATAIWESILFDLRSLKPQGVFQVDRLTKSNPENEASWIAQILIRKMLSDGLLDTQTGKKERPLKGF